MFVGTSYKESSSFIRETLEETLFPPYMVMCLGGVWSAINHSGMRKPGRNEINARRREKSKGGAESEHRAAVLSRLCSLPTSGFLVTRTGATWIFCRLQPNVS